MQWWLYAGHKKPEISFKWSLVVLYRWSLYREKFDQKSKGRTATWSLWIGGCFMKVFVKTGLTVFTLLFAKHLSHENSSIDLLM